MLKWTLIRESPGAVVVEEGLKVLGVFAGAASALLTITRLFKALKSGVAKIMKRFSTARRIESDVRDLSSKIDGVIAQLKNNGGSSIKDALDRIETRQSLHEHRQRAIIADMSSGVFETDHEGRCNWVNRRYCMLTGRLPDEIMGYGWRNTIAPEDRDRIGKDWDSALDDQRDFEQEYSILTPEGVRRHIRVRTTKLLDAKGKVAGYLGMVEEVGSHQ